MSLRAGIRSKRVGRLAERYPTEIRARLALLPPPLWQVWKPRCPEIEVTVAEVSITGAGLVVADDPTGTVPIGKPAGLLVDDLTVLVLVRVIRPIDDGFHIGVEMTGPEHQRKTLLDRHVANDRRAHSSEHRWERAT